ncbi:MAG: M14 family zinc carboxypeptidase [Bacteroidota bacterium]
MPFTPYLNTDEINTALQQFAADNPGLCTLITLPNLSFEGRTSYALKIAGGAAVSRKGVLLLGGTHAREWGSSDILVALAEKMIAAYNAGTGITFQGKSFTSAEIVRIIENIDVFIFPNVNPDGKVYTQSGHDWRKNRRPIGADIGIDINRNYDILWDATTYFNAALDFSYLYAPASSNYHGPIAFSEAESLNVKWMLDNYPNIVHAVDLHSYGQKIMYTWGDDENQENTVEQNFMNSTYNGQRGLSGDAYGEFVFKVDQDRIVSIADRMHNAIFAVRGMSYSVGQIFNEVGVDSGSSACYFFSRHFSDISKRKLFGYGIEWGAAFQPASSEMLNIMDDIDSALTELCLCASEPELFIRDSLSDTGKEPSEGILCMSPDIITRKTAVPDPAAAFGDVTIDPGSDRVEIGNDNYIYVRVHNHGGMQTSAKVRVYFAPLTTSCSPALWQFIDEIDVIDIPAGGFKVTDAVVWPHVPDPGTAGHFCIIAICGNTIDPIPDTSMIDSASDYMKFVSNSNNIAYRNVTFEDVLPDTWFDIPFVMRGFSSKPEEYNLVFEAPLLPKNTLVEMKLRRTLLFDKVYRVQIDKRAEIKNIQIPSARSINCRLRIKIPSRELIKKNCSIVVIQKIGNQNAGQFTVYF